MKSVYIKEIAKENQQFRACYSFISPEVEKNQFLSLVKKKLHFLPDLTKSWLNLRLSPRPHAITEELIVLSKRLPFPRVDAFFWFPRSKIPSEWESHKCGFSDFISLKSFWLPASSSCKMRESYRCERKHAILLFLKELIPFWTERVLLVEFPIQKAKWKTSDITYNRIGHSFFYLLKSK